MLLDSPLPRHMPSSLHTALDSLVRTIAHQYPGAGIRMVQSHLLTHGYRVQQARVRNSLERVDPHGLAVRWSTYGSIHRRVYRVAYPNAVWHADGNMALIRWGFVIHGGVDGYSRLVVYLQCSTNNRAEAVSTCWPPVWFPFSGTVRLWGGELFGCTVHVITSWIESWKSYDWIFYQKSKN